MRLRLPSRHYTAFALASILGLAVLCWAYAAGLPGEFVFDDEPNINDNAPFKRLEERPTPERLWQAAWTGQSSPLGRPLSMLSFALNVATTGFEPGPMKITNIVIHALTGLVLFWLTQILLAQIAGERMGAVTRRWLGLATVAIWLVHPINVMAVTYIVQRMTSLSGLFTAAALVSYALLRRRQQRQSGGWILHLPVFVLLAGLGLLAKETAALIPVYCLALEITVFRFSTISPLDRRLLRLAYGMGIITAVALLVAFFAGFDGILQGYRFREFTLEQRLLTEARIVAWYLAMIVVPNITQMGLYHDTLPISTSLLSPPTTLVSLLFLAGLLAAAWIGRQRAPLASLGVFWFLGGHLLESTVLPLELVFEHRNYLPSFGIILALVVGTHAVLTKRRPQAPKLTAAIFIAVFLAAAGLTHLRASHWASYNALALAEQHYRPDSPRANEMAGGVYSALAKAQVTDEDRDHYILLAEESYLRAAALAPDRASALIGRLFVRFEHHLPLPDGLLDQIQHRLRNGRIDATTQGALITLTDCTIDRKCQLTEDQFTAILDAAFDNPALRLSYRTDIVRSLARYYSEAHGDQQAAILLAKKAVEINPNKLSARFDELRYLALGGYFHEATGVLDQIETLDTTRAYADLISEWRKTLSDHMQPLPGRNTDPVPLPTRPHP